MRDEPRRVVLGDLDCAVLGGPKGDGMGDGPLVMLLHGFGAPGDDLVPFGEVLPLPREVRWVFPTAPLALDVGFSGGDARAWWMIDMARLERQIMSGQGASLVREEPQGLTAAREAVLGALAAIPGTLGDPGAQLILGGFSQGAMLATDVALSSALPLAGLALLSGTVVGEPRWRGLATQGGRTGLRVFQSHGTSDPILPYAGAELLRDLLTAGGLEVQFRGFPGQHEIPAPVLRELAGFLDETIGSKRR